MPKAESSSSRRTRRRSLPVSLNGSSAQIWMRSGVRAERKCSLDVAAQLVFGGLRPRLEHHGRDHPLPPLDIRDADHGRRLDGGVLEEDVLDLARGQVLAAPDDHVVEPSLHEQVALRVDPPGVAGVEPPVVDGVGAAEVLAGDLVAAHPDLARLAVGHRPALGVTDRHLDPGQDAPDGSEPCPHVGLVAAEGRPVIIGAEHGDGARGLGEPVGVHQVEPVEEHHGPLHHRAGHRTPAVGKRSHGGQTRAVGVDDVEDAAEHRRHDHGVGDRLGPDGCHPGVGVEALELHHAAADVGRRQHR